MDKLCYIPAGNTRGYCTNAVAIAGKRFNNCILDNCVAETNTSNSILLVLPAGTGLVGCTACLPQYIGFVCANGCTNRIDNRGPTDGYIYNCQSNTRALATGCELTQLMTGCDTFTPMSGSIAQTLSVMVVLLATVLSTIL
jgi:hypothetical protein